MKKLCLALFCCLSLSGCITTGPSKGPMTPLQIQSIQSREFEAPRQTVFASVISTFQDLGYNITTADINSGYISAESPTESNDISFGSFLDSLAEDDTSTHSNKQIRGTAFMEAIGPRVRVRLNFVEVRQSSSAQGKNTRRDKRILASPFYQNIFNRIGNAIFIRKAHQ